MKRFFLLSSLLLVLSNASASGFTFLSQLTGKFHLPEHVLTFALVGLILLITGLVYRSKITTSSNTVIPDKGISLRNIIDSYGEFIYGQCRAVIGEKEAPKYFTFIATLFLFIFLSNFIGLIPGFLPPTENINTTLALGVVSFVYYNIVGCKEVGTINYIKHFCGPLWYMAVLMFPIEIISNFVRPFSLALRLRGNMFGDHLVLGIFSGLVPYVVPILFLILGLLVCLIQAYVFTVLTMVYISLATAHQDHGEEHAH